MQKYRVSWIESRLHYIEVDADDEDDAIEMVDSFDYEETASDEAWYDNNYTAKVIEDEGIYCQPAVVNPARLFGSSHDAFRWTIKG